MGSEGRSVGLEVMIVEELWVCEREDEREVADGRVGRVGGKRDRRER